MNPPKFWTTRYKTEFTKFKKLFVHKMRGYVEILRSKFRSVSRLLKNKSKKQGVKIKRGDQLSLQSATASKVQR